MTLIVFIMEIPYSGPWRFLRLIREDAYSRTAYFIRHTALSRTYAIVAYIRHNNNADSLVFGIPVLPHWPESSQLQMKLQCAWNQRTHPSLWFKTHGCEKNDRQHIMFVLSKARISLSTWLNEPRHCSYLLVSPTNRTKGPSEKMT